MAHSRARADLVLLFITALWGCTFVVVKDALSLAEPFGFLPLRFVTGAIAATLFAGRTMAHRPSLRSGVTLGGFLFLGYAFQTTGLQYTTPSRSAFITGLCVVFVPFVSFVLFRRAPRIFSMIGVALSVTGLYLLTIGAEVTVDRPAPTGPGDFLTFLCAIAFAVHIALTERYAKQAKPIPLVATQLWIVFACTLAMAPLMPHKVEVRGSLIVAVLVTGLLASALAIILQTWAQAETTAVRAALIFSLEPVFAAIYSVLMGKERLGRPELIGGSLIVLGVLVAELGGPVVEKLKLKDSR